MAPIELCLVHVYELPDRLFLHPMARTEAGFWLAVEPAQRMQLEASADELGVAVHALIARPRDPVPTPARADYPEVTRPVLRAGGLKTWMTLELKARLCEVVREPERVLVVPTESGGTRGDRAGFHRLQRDARPLPLDVGPSELGKAVRVALASSHGPKDGRAA